MIGLVQLFSSRWNHHCCGVLLYGILTWCDSVVNQLEWRKQVNSVNKQDECTDFDSRFIQTLVKYSRLVSRRVK